jgi:hypothetical protein
MKKTNKQTKKKCGDTGDCLCLSLKLGQIPVAEIPENHEKKTKKQKK